MSERSLKVKLLTIWRDETGGREEKESEERKSEKRNSQKTEDQSERKGRKVASGGRKVGFLK